MAHDVGEWLLQLGLGKYAEAFAENDVEFEVLSELSDDDLSQLGLSLGHRRKFLKAIAELTAGAQPEAPTDVAEASPASTKRAEAERRQLTVMFCDLVGSTALSTRLDPEDLREVMRRYQDAVAGAVARYEGHVAKFLGDGVLAYFGWPQAHEDQAERAIRAALDAVSAVAGVRLNGGEALEARVGIASGQVVVGDTDLEAEAVTGETPNLAARLQAVASPGDVIIGSATRRLIGEAFVLEDLGTHTIKGFAEPVLAWRVVRESMLDSRFEAVHAGRLTDFIGREEETNLLLRRWEQAKQDEGQVVLLSGEAGIGKSRITLMLRERLVGEPHVRIHYQCSPHHTNTAFYPFIRQLEYAAGFNLDDTADQKLDKIEELFAQSTTSVGEAAPLMAALMSVTTVDRYPPLQLLPQQQKQLTLTILCDQLIDLATKQSVLAIFEDAQWADPTSLEALEQVIDRVQSAQVLAVITFRPEFMPPWHGHTHVTALALNRLGRDQCAAIVPAVARGKLLPNEVIDQIVAKTDGVPLFVEELTKTVIESGILEERADRYELTGPLPPLAIPTTLQDSLMARLDREGPVKEVAQIGAAIGREFSHRLLAEVSTADDNNLSDALERLVESELIFRRGRPPDATYVFKHALVQDAAYESLLRSTRQGLHLRIAEALEGESPDMMETEPEIMAHHFTEARHADRAVPYLESAGNRAAAASASVEAVNHFEKALSLLTALPEEQNRDRQELSLRIALGGALQRKLGPGSAEGGESYARAYELAENVGDERQLFEALFGMWRYSAWQAGPSQTLALAEQLLFLSERTKDNANSVVGHYALGSTLWKVGELTPALQHFEDASALYEPALRTSLIYRMGHDQGVTSLVVQGLLLWMLGRPETALEKCRQALALSEDVADPSTSASANVFAALLAEFLRMPALAQKHAEIAQTVANEYGFPGWGAAAILHSALARLDFEHAEERIRLLKQGLASWDATGATLFRPYYQSRLAEAHARMGQVKIAEETLLEAARAAKHVGENWCEGEILRLYGELLYTLKRDEAKAERKFQEALDIAHRQGARSWELRAAMSLARLWREQGKFSGARELLSPIFCLFTEGFDTPDLKDAKALLDELN